MKTAAKPMPNFALEAHAHACRACGASKNQTPCGRERSLDFGQELYLCGNCGLAYLAPDFTDAALSEFYQHHYRRVSLVDAAKVHDEKFFQQKLNREFAAQRVALIAEQLPQNARVLEIGSGFGAFLGQLHRLRPDVTLYATEEDEAHRTLLLDGAPVDFITHEHIQWQVPFDLIIALHVVEHLKHPVEDIRLFAAMLTAGGRFMVEVPDINARWGNWLYVQPAHVSYFSEASLRRTLQRANVAIDYLGVHPAGAVLAGNLWAVVRQGDPAVRPVVLPATEAEIAVLRAHIARYRWNIFQAARKWVRDIIIFLCGVNLAGSLARRRYYKRNRLHFAT